MSGTAPGLVVLGLGVSIPTARRTNDYWPDSFRLRFAESSRRDLSILERSVDGSLHELDPAVA